MPNTPPNLIARGDIAPSRFVTKDATTEFGATQSGAGAQIIGVSMEGSREAPIPSVTTPLAAIDGESFKLYGDGDVCLVEAGAAVTAGLRVKADANGMAIDVALATDEYGGVALQAAAGINELIQIQVILGP